MPDEPVPTWEPQINNALMNAGAALEAAPKPVSIEEATGLAFAWIGLAQAWRERQAKEFESVPAGEEVPADAK